MSLQISTYTDQHTYEVTQFNKRLRQGGVRFQFPESPIPHWLPPKEGRPLRQEFFVAVDDEGAVHGAYILKHQPFLAAGEILSVGNYQLPLSEGTIDRTYSSVALQLLTDALKRQPLLYALGMGGLDRPLPKMLAAMGWQLKPVPFYFRVCHPQSFLKNLTLLRERPAWRILGNVAAATGVGSVGILSLQASRKKKRTRLGRMTVEAAPEFGSWANDLWEEHSAPYSLCAVRRRPELNNLYPANNSRFHRLLVTVDENTVGWAVILHTPMRNHNYFGNMHVGTIADCFAAPAHVDGVIGAATEYLEDHDVDLIVSNQMHPWYGSALANSGFLSGPSNFVFATSKALTKAIAATDTANERIHINRGDGDGPIHL